MSRGERGKTDAVAILRMESTDEIQEENNSVHSSKNAIPAAAVVGDASFYSLC